MKSIRKKKTQFIIDEQKENLNFSELDTTGTIPETGDLLEEISSQLQKIQTMQLNVAQQTISTKEVDKTAILIEDIIPVLDSFERTLDLAKTFSDNELLFNWMKNIEAIYRKLRAVLGRQGLREIETIGKKVDFSQHEVVEYRETNEFPENIIVEEKQHGYQFRDKIIRDAKVVVAKSIAKS